MAKPRRKKPAITLGKTAAIIVAEKKKRARAVEADWHVVAMPKGPSVNTMFRNIKNGRKGQKGRAKTKQYLAWGAEAGRILRASSPPIMSSEYELRLQLGPRKGSDLDNYVKAVNDLLKTHRIVTDDSYQFCKRVTLEWADDLPSKMCRVSFRPFVREAQLARTP